PGSAANGRWTGLRLSAAHQLLPGPGCHGRLVYQHGAVFLQPYTQPDRGGHSDLCGYGPSDRRVFHDKTVSQGRLAKRNLDPREFHRFVDPQSGGQAGGAGLDPSAIGRGVLVVPDRQGPGIATLALTRGSTWKPLQEMLPPSGCNG